MSGHFTIDKVEYAEERLTLRCVREFFYPDGFMADDVWIWEIERPKEKEVHALSKLAGRAATFSEVATADDEASLTIWLDDGEETLALSGARILKKEEPFSPSDLLSVVSTLSKSLQLSEEVRVGLNRKLASIEAFLHEKIERARRRAAFEELRQPVKAAGLNREIEDLETILRKLREPNQSLFLR
jgi:hypothetical protein